LKLTWKGAVGIVLSAVLLWWTLRDVSLAVVWSELRRSNGWLFLLSTFLSTIIFPLRARRWQTILEPVAPNQPLGALWRATAVGMMANNVLPARAGEIARAYALTQQTKVPLATSIASLAVDRLFDMLVLLLLAVAAFLDPAFPRDAEVAGQTIGSLAQGSVVLVTLVFAALYGLAFFPTQIVRIYEIFTRRISKTLEDRGKAVLTRFSEGLSVLKSPRRFLAVLSWTIIHWLVNALGFWYGFKAVGIELPFSAALFLQTLIAVGVALPSAPGFFGFFEKITVVGLAIYGVGAPLATSFAIGYHILTFIPITVIGLWYFAKLGLHLKEIDQARGDGG
jgi:uncharacterized protein (TIRG00374 family)